MSFRSSAWLFLSPIITLCMINSQLAHSNGTSPRQRTRKDPSVFLHSKKAKARDTTLRHRTKRDDFTFSRSKHKCVDVEGNEGYNRGTYSPCTDFTDMTLHHGQNKYKLQRANRNLVASNFKNSNLKGIHFKSAELRFANFKGADLSNAIFERVDLKGAYFEGADLSNVEFIGVEDEHAGVRKHPYQLEGATFDYSTQPQHLHSFWYSKNMIRVGNSKEPGIDYEIEGAVLKKMTWNEETQKGKILLNTYTEQLHFSFSGERLHSEVNAYLGQKVKIGFKDSNLIFVEPMGVH